MPWRIILSFALTGWLALPDLLAQTSEFRALWVDAWGTGFLNTSQVQKLVSDCRKYNYNAVIVQMRRRGDAFYMPSGANREPRTTALAAGYDALADLIAQCHSGSPRIQVHCWVVCNLIWSASTPPTQAGHVFRVHPEYLMKDSQGDVFLAEGYYLDPGNPEAMAWNHAMAVDIASRYDIDGFNWDYIRYPQPDSGYNDRALARFNAEFRRTGQPAPSDTVFSDWRRRQVTDFLRWTSADLLALKPQLIVSAAVFSSRTDAFNARFQDWAAWNREGLIDLCLPMTYSANNDGVFLPRIRDAAANQGVRRVYVGLGAYMNTKENTVTQLQAVRSEGFLGSILYSYRTPNSGSVDQTATFSWIRDQHQASWANPPSLPWKTAPSKGILRGQITGLTSTGVYNASVTIQTSPSRIQRADANGRFAFFDLPPGTFTVTASAPGYENTQNSTSVQAGRVSTLNLRLQPPDVTAPVIANVQTSNVTDISAAVLWTTGEPATSVVQFGITHWAERSLTNSLLVTEHRLALDQLRPDTAYQFRVTSQDRAGNQAAAGPFQLQTQKHLPVSIETVTAASGALTLRWHGQPSFTYLIESSSDLRSWSTYAGVTSPVEWFEFIDDEPLTGQRFYRIRSP